MKSPKTKVPEKKFTLQMNSTNQVIIAAIVVLLIFVVAVLSSVPKKDQTQGQTTTTATTATNGTRTGTQVARISITREGQTQEMTPAELAKSQMTSGNVAAATAGGQNADTAVPAGGRVKFKIDTFKKLAAQPLKFTLYDEYGKELTPDYLQTVNEKKIHFIVVSANLREYQHLYPEYSNGTWNVSANLPNTGTYYAYTLISPVKGNPAILRSNLTVQAPSKGTLKYPGLTPNNLSITGGVSTVLKTLNAGLGGETQLSFSLTQGGKNSNNIRPLLGAFGYVLIMRQTDTDTFIQARPLPVSDESKGMFDFGATFMKAGRYTAFCEFNAGGKVMLFPITFDVQ